MKYYTVSVKSENKQLLKRKTFSSKMFARLYVLFVNALSRNEARISHKFSA